MVHASHDHAFLMNQKENTKEIYRHIVTVNILVVHATHDHAFLMNQKENTKEIYWHIVTVNILVVMLPMTTPS